MGATTMSVLLLMYIEPLDDDASLIFVSMNLDYFGDPVGCILMAVLCFMNAAVLWVFGRYGLDCGYIAVLVSVFCVQRVLLTFLYLSNFVNPLIDEGERKARKARMDMSNALSANFDMLHQHHAPTTSTSIVPMQQTTSGKGDSD